VRELDKYDPDVIADLRARDEFFWLDLDTPDEATLRALADQLRWHPLAVEDTREWHQRPKLDDYEDHVLLVFYGVRPTRDERDATPLEVHIYVHGGYVVTIHRGCSELAAIRARAQRREPQSEQGLVYMILDGLTDTFFPVLQAIDSEIDELEAEITLDASHHQVERMFHLKRHLLGLRRVVGPMRDIFATRLDSLEDLPGLQKGSRDYFRDIWDHLMRIAEQIDSYRDVLSSAMDVYLSSVSNRVNDVVKQLTVIATIFLPLSFIVGFFGMNFGWMVQRIDTAAAFFGLGFGTLILSCVILFAFFRRKGYL
jgi:magnesium transporter